MLIKAGSTLLVPRSSKTGGDVASGVADNAQISLAPEIVTRRTTVKARKQETVASIAKRYSLSAVDVADWNKLKAASALKPGQQVVVYLPIKMNSRRAASSDKSSVKTKVRRPQANVIRKKR